MSNNWYRDFQKQLDENEVISENIHECDMQEEVLDEQDLEEFETQTTDYKSLAMEMAAVLEDVYGEQVHGFIDHTVDARVKTVLEKAKAAGITMSTYGNHF